MSYIRYNSDGSIRRSSKPAVEKIRLSENDAKDPSAVAAAVLRLSSQLDRLSAMVPSEVREYEVTISPGTTQTVNLYHGLNNAVRYWAAEWTSGDPFPSVRRDSANSTANSLALVVTTSSVTAASTMVFRVEPSA